MDTQKLPQSRGTEMLDEECIEKGERKRFLHEIRLLTLLLTVWIMLHLAGLTVGYYYNVGMSMRFNSISLLSGIIFLFIVDYVSGKEKEKIPKMIDLSEDVVGITMITSFIVWIGCLIWHFIK